jgi:hypothetical protein
MEYRAGTTGSWTACAAGSTTGLQPGTYQVRLSVTGNSFVGAVTTVVIYTPADYTAVDELISFANALNRSKYTTASLAVLDAAIAAVVRGLDISQQTIVDGFARAINNAIDSLVERNQEEVPVTSLRINTAPIVSVKRGEILRFMVTLNDGAQTDGIVWSVSSKTYATVDNKGTVTILNKTGTVILTAADLSSGLSHSIILRIT